MDKSRRNFLKGSVAVGTLASLNLNANQIAANMANGGEKFVYSICEMCSSRCAITAKIVDKKGVFISGNPNFNSNKTSVCARGGSGFNQVYDEQRLIKPLIRTGKRG